MRILENEKLMVQIADLGAELTSVLDKESGLDRMHDGDPKVWPRHAPFLFPFVGRVVDGVYRVGEKEYSMDLQLGFARDLVLECVEKSYKKVVHKLVSTESTKEIYPFDFELYITHELEEENPRLLKISWEVKNTGENTMYYFIGGHPGFSLPETDPKAKEEYYLEFEGKESITYFGVNEQSGFAAPGETKTLPLEQGILKFHPDIYITLIFDEPKFSKVRILRPDKTPYITMECSQFEGFGIWSKEEGNYICLEPWKGRTDDHGFTGKIDEKFGVQILEQGESHLISHSIEFHK